MSFTNFTEGKSLGMFTGAAYTPPATLYFAAFSVSPTDSGGGTEISGNAYARVAVTASTGMSSTLGDPSTCTNTGAILFPAATAAWPDVTAIGIFDAATGGNLMDYGVLTTAKSIGTSDTLQLLAGDYQIRID